MRAEFALAAECAAETGPESTAETANTCRRCGQCCKLGGPTLLPEDLPLVTGGYLPLASLVCLRAGEWVRDDAASAGSAATVLRPLAQECIKIAGCGRGRHPWQCIFYADGGCRIYASQPVQCKTLFCANTAPMMALLARDDALSRRSVWEALPANVPLPFMSAMSPMRCEQIQSHEQLQQDISTRSLWPELVAAYEEVCPVGPYVKALAVSRGSAGPTADVRLDVTSDVTFDVTSEVRPAVVRDAALECAELCRRDVAFRALCVERKAAPAEFLPFLLGRPLKDLAVPQRTLVSGAS